MILSDRFRPGAFVRYPEKRDTKRQQITPPGAESIASKPRREGHIIDIISSGRHCGRARRNAVNQGLEALAQNAYAAVASARETRRSSCPRSPSARPRSALATGTFSVMTPRPSAKTPAAIPPSAPVQPASTTTPSSGERTIFSAFSVIFLHFFVHRINATFSSISFIFDFSVLIHCLFPGST